MEVGVDSVSRKLTNSCDRELPCVCGGGGAMIG